MTSPPGSSAPTPPTRRHLRRERTLEAIKDAARAQIATSGAAGTLSLNTLAKTLGMAGPSLYRYFDSRDALITELLVDAYGELADGAEAISRRGGAPREQLSEYLHSYRSWALEHPERYDLLYGSPVPGYAAPPGATSAPAARGLLPLVSILADLRSQRRGSTAAPGRAPSPALSPGWSAALGAAGAEPEDFLDAVAVWTRFHGLLSLELAGHLAQMVTDPGALYQREVVRTLAALDG